MPLSGPQTSDPLGAQLAHLRDRLGLSSVMGPLGERVGSLAGASQPLAELRHKGWTWFGGLEAELRQLAAQAHERQHSAEATRASLTAPLAARLDRVTSQLGGAGPAPELKRELDAIDAALVSCESQLETALQAWSAAVDQALAQIRGGSEALSAFASAGFALPAGERPLLVYGASWLDDPDPPPGVLLFTDARVRYERRDDRIARRNRMGLAVERNVDRTLLLDETPDALLAAHDASTGFLVREPRIALTLRAGKTTTLRLEQPVVPELLALTEGWRRRDLSRFR